MHGSLSVQKAESVALTNGSGVRGGGKVEGDVGAQSLGKADRASLSERERANGKGVAKYVLWMLSMGCIDVAFDFQLRYEAARVSHVRKSG